MTIKIQLIYGSLSLFFKANVFNLAWNQVFFFEVVGLMDTSHPFMFNPFSSILDGSPRINTLSYYPAALSELKWAFLCNLKKNEFFSSENPSILLKGDIDN